MSRRLVSSIINLLLAILIVPIAWISYTEISRLLGLRATPVEVAGTGSMYPSLFWDESQGGPEKVSEVGVAEYRSSPRMYRYYSGFRLGDKTLLKSSLSRGDMVAFSSGKTRDILAKEGKDPNLGFIKRIIAVPGDTLELRDGFVILNGTKISEPYIRTPRSTYGGNTLAECQQITVPLNSYFVLGDNRKVSSDSRFDLGLVNETDIQYYLPLSKQELYKTLWRDTSKDDSLSGTPTLQATEVYQNLRNLKKHSQLERSSRLRGEAILANEQTATNLKVALQKAGYKNIVTGEFVIYGHFTGSELWENLQANYETRSQLQNPDFTDIGVSAVTGEVAGCPTQVIVGHLGGYVPATYSTEVVASWQEAKASLETVIPSWEKALGQDGVNQAKLQELLNLLKTRQALVAEVLAVMSKREWISDDLQARIDRDSQVSQAAETLAQELNRGN